MNFCGDCRLAVVMAADGRGNCCGRTSSETAVGIAPDSRELPCGDCRVAVVMTADGRGYCHGMFHGNCRELPRTSVGCHGRYDGLCHGQSRGTCRGQIRGSCRGSATGRGNCRANRPISTVARGNTDGRLVLPQHPPKPANFITTVSRLLKTRKDAVKIKISYIYFLVREGLLTDDAGVERGTALQEIRPWTGSKTGDFVKNKFGGLP